MVNAALDSGVNFFDTANSYVGGVSETMLGVALKGKRQDAVIASKFFNPMGHRPNDSGMSRLHIKQQIEGSLKRLQTDYIDLYQFHHIDRDTPWDEIWQAMEVAVQQGKILYAGSSNFAGWHIAKAQADAQTPAIDAVLKQDIEDLTSLNVTKTPTFIINGRSLPTFGDKQLKALVAEEVTKARK